MASVVFLCPLGSMPGMCLSDDSAVKMETSNISRHVRFALSLTGSFVVHYNLYLHSLQIKLTCYSLRTRLVFHQEAAQFKEMN